jgi:hypothetical protein
MGGIEHCDAHRLQTLALGMPAWIKRARSLDGTETGARILIEDGGSMQPAWPLHRGQGQAGKNGKSGGAPLAAA